MQSIRPQKGEMLRAEMKPTRNVSVRMTLESRNANPMAQPDEKSKWEIVVNLVMVQLRRETKKQGKETQK